MSSVRNVATAVAHAVGEANKSLVSGEPRIKSDSMAQCDVCGNDYEVPMEIRLGDRVSTFDCFECAIHAMAPACECCGCRIIGHGVEAAGKIYCCAHCARRADRR